MDVFDLLKLPVENNWSVLIGEVRFRRRTIDTEKPKTEPKKPKEAKKKEKPKQMSLLDIENALRQEILKNPQNLAELLKGVKDGKTKA